MNSKRGQRTIWFKNRKGQPVCQKCWYATHKVTCIVCGKSDIIQHKKRNFSIKQDGKVLCRNCYVATFLQHEMTIPSKITMAMITIFRVNLVNLVNLS